MTDVATSRMIAQGLAKPLGGVTDVVRHMVGLQAQDDWVAAFAVRPRATSKVDAAAVDKAVATDDLICTWLMRGTLHLVAADDVRWLLALLAPRFLAGQRRRRLQLGLTDDLVSEALPVIRDLGLATRAQICSAVRKRGLDLATGQAEAHLVAAAAMHGLIHRRGKTYLPLPEGGSTPDDPLHELARRYVAGYGSVEAQDFAAWSGLPITAARRGLDGIEAPKARAVRTRVRMLGHWDPYLLGYRDRSFTLDPAHARHIQRGGGFLQPIIVADGRVCGTWSRERKGDKLIVRATSFGGKLPDLDAELADLGRFFGAEAELG